MNSSPALSCAISSLPLWRANAWKSRTDPGSVATTLSTSPLRSSASAFFAFRIGSGQFSPRASTSFFASIATTIPLLCARARVEELRLDPAPAQPVGERNPGAGAPAPHFGGGEQLELGQFGRQPDLADRQRVVGDDHLVHTLEVVDADQLGGQHFEAGLLAHFALEALLRGLARFHEAGDEPEHPPLPRRVARQQQPTVAVGALDHRREQIG